MAIQGIDLNQYDHIIVAFSGGKDSTACVLDLLECGVDKNKIELWHHLVDGREGSSLMDWPVTEDYCRKFAGALGLTIFFSWKDGGFEREMLRHQEKTQANHFEHPPYSKVVWNSNRREYDHNIIECGIVGGVRGKDTTREKFPQVSGDLKVRWCSAYLKIDVCTAAINNQARFIGKKTLVVSGERAEESPQRSKYKTFEPDRADNRNGKRIKRHVDHLRPVHSWSEAQVWDIIKRHGIIPHPAYRLGWGRLSCMSCIFGSDRQWASVNSIAPGHIEKIAQYEKDFGLTIHRDKAVMDRVAAASPYESINPVIVRMALSKGYYGGIKTQESIWELPAGAFGESAGPT